MRYQQEVDTAVWAAKKAGAVIRQYAEGGATRDFREKSYNELVTQADTEAQDTVLDHLSDHFPAYGILAEEGGEYGTEREGGEPYRWIVDPVDGTTNFAHRLPPYSVSIALQETSTSEIVVGVVYELGRDDLFTAVQDEGFYCNGVRQRVADEDRLASSLITTGFPYRDFSFLEEYMVSLRRFMRRTQGIRRPGSASVDLAYVASGRFSGFFEVGLLPWDIAAGMLFVQEAGGRVTDFAGEPCSLWGRQICASNGAVHAEMLEALEPMIDALPADAKEHQTSDS